MRVTHVVRYDAGLYRGGGEIKAERTREALAGIGVDVRVHAPLDEAWGELVHFFGSMGYYWTLAETCRRLHVPYVCSPIFVTPRSPARLKWRKVRLRILEGKSNLARLFENAAELYFQTGRERTNFEAFYGRPRVAAIVPNGVEPRFAQGDVEAFRKRYGITKRFVLQTGTIGPNKGQLALIQAAQGLDLDVVVLGRENDPAYMQACRRAAGPNVQFLDPLAHDDPLLAGAYAAAEVFCLASRDDIFANAAMEAAVAGCRLILGDAWGGQEIYGEWAQWVRPGDAGAIRHALQVAQSRPHDAAAQSRHFLDRYSWTAVASQLKTRYEAILNRSDT